MSERRSVYATSAALAEAARLGITGLERRVETAIAENGLHRQLDGRLRTDGGFLVVDGVLVTVADVRFEGERRWKILRLESYREVASA